MKPELIYLAAIIHGRADSSGGRPYRCLNDRVYQSAANILRDVEQYTRKNVGAIAVVLSFTIVQGLVVEASYMMGFPDVQHSIGVRDCTAVYQDCLLAPITSYLDTICRANAEIGDRNVQA